ncbi:MAG: type II secretion system protein [Verrucomicrobiaceae bacterium]|nr:type II secretion system protein [Verrucomicrobiaceae bacterium]
MKSHRLTLTPSRGFTLIEMLVVIGIIALLATMAVPAANVVMGKVKRVRTQAALKDLTVGIKAYQTEYSRYPVPSGYSSETPVPLSQGSGVLKVLLGVNEQNMNTRGIVFIEPPPAKNGAGGLTGDQGSYGYMDMWGEPYYVVMDVNYDNKIQNPDVANMDRDVSNGAPQQLITGAIAYSVGEDKKVNTKDDVVSWRN